MWDPDGGFGHGTEVHWGTFPNGSCLACHWTKGDSTQSGNCSGTLKKKMGWRDLNSNLIAESSIDLRLDDM